MRNIKGLGSAKHSSLRKPLISKCYTSIFLNLGILCFFKYFNFFVESFVDAFTFFGIQAGLLHVKNNSTSWYKLLYVSNDELHDRCLQKKNRTYT